MPLNKIRKVFYEAFEAGSVSYSKHFRKRMAQRGVDANDLMKLASCGMIYNPPEIDINSGCEKYRIEHSGMNLKVIFTLLEEGNKIRLITVMD